MARSSSFPLPRGNNRLHPIITGLFIWKYNTASLCSHVYIAEVESEKNETRNIKRSAETSVCCAAFALVVSAGQESKVTRRLQMSPRVFSYQNPRNNLVFKNADNYVREVDGSWYSKGCESLTDSGNIDPGVPSFGGKNHNHSVSFLQRRVNQSQRVRMHDEVESARVHWIVNVLCAEGNKKESGNLLWDAYYPLSRSVSIGSFVSSSDSVTVNGRHQPDTKLFLWNVWANKVSSAHVKAS